MGKAIPYDLRLKIVERCQNGESYEDIACKLGLSSSGVRKLWYKYQREGESALHTRYKNCGGKSIYGQEVHQAVAELRDHDQGADYVCSKLRLKYPELPVPSSRTVQRWWVAQGTNRSKGAISKAEKRDGVSKFTKSGK